MAFKIAGILDGFMFAACGAGVCRIALSALRPVKHDPCDKVFAEILEPVFDRKEACAAFRSVRRPP